MSADTGSCAQPRDTYLESVGAGVGSSGARQAGDDGLALPHAGSPQPERPSLRAGCPQRKRLLQQLSSALPALAPATQGAAQESRTPEAERCVFTLPLLVLLLPAQRHSIFSSFQTVSRQSSCVSLDADLFELCAPAAQCSESAQRRGILACNAYRCCRQAVHWRRHSRVVRCSSCADACAQT